MYVKMKSFYDMYVDMDVEHVRENVCEMKQQRMHVEDIRICSVSKFVGETQEDVADILTLRQAVNENNEINNAIETDKYLDIESCKATYEEVIKSTKLKKKINPREKRSQTFDDGILQL